MWESLLKIITNSKIYIPVVTLLVIFVLLKVLNKTLKKIVKKNTIKKETKKRNTIVTLAFNILKYMIIVFGMLIILSSWGVDVTSIIAGLGVAGVVAGLALQDALKDIIMGCNIILDNFYVVGDYITYNDFTGEVIEFGLKNTKIKDSLNRVLVVSNRNIDKVINYSQSKFMIPILINTAYEEKTEKVSKVIEEITNEISAFELIDEAKFVGLQQLGDSAVQYKILVYCNPINQFQVERDVNRLIKDRLDENNIKIPYNQLEVHNGK